MRRAGKLFEGGARMTRFATSRPERGVCQPAFGAEGAGAVLVLSVETALGSVDEVNSRNLSR
jgi:hypothetical protein